MIEYQLAKLREQRVSLTLAVSALSDTLSQEIL